MTNILPRGADSNGIIMIKLKRKLSFRGHVYFEAVSPDLVNLALTYLKDNNHLYSDIVIDVGQIPSILLSLTEPVDNYDHDVDDIGSQIEENENPLDAHRLSAHGTTLISNMPHSEELTIAPGESKQPMSILNDQYCEELPYPYFSLLVSPVKYFNQRLLNYKQNFASDADYTFFALSVTQQLNLNSQINIAMKKVSSSSLTSGMLSNNFSETFKSFIAKDEGFNFMNPIKGTPAYWKRFPLEVLVMIKQLGLPTYFMTLSCADLRWNELVSIISN